MIWRRRPRSDQRGTLALELSIIAPILLMIFLLFWAFGRYGQVAGLVEQAARDSARAASQQRSAFEMETAIAGVRQEIAKQLPSSCAQTLSQPPKVDFRTTEESAGQGFARGNFITVTYSCTISYSDLMLPGWQDQEITRSFTSRLDPNRGVY